MIETKFGLKYPMPHTLVHIVDNSSYTGDLPIAVADEPSLYGAIVVTGAPMGEDNRVIDIKRSDVLGTAYGLSSLGAGDIQKYGQTVTYPMALIDQGGPVKLLRVTPDDSTYAYSCVTIEWRWDTTDNMMHVRFNTERLDTDNSLSGYKTRDRLNAAIVKSFARATTPAPDTDQDGEPWKKRAFIVNISAGRGSVYNNFATTINQTVQGKKPPNARYQFTTIDTRNNAVIEQFYASLINYENINRPDAIDSVNVIVKKRVDGSSIVVPYVNEAAIRELYTDYREKFAEMLEAEEMQDVITDYMRNAYAAININTFDPIFGNYLYNGTDDFYKMPFFQVDMRSSDVPMLPVGNRIYTIENNDDNPSLLDEKLLSDSLASNGTVVPALTYGISRMGDAVYVGDVYLYSGKSSLNNPYLYIVGVINQYTGVITSVKANSFVVDGTASNGSFSCSSAVSPTSNNQIINDGGRNNGKFVSNLVTIVDNLDAALRTKIKNGVIKAGDTIALKTDSRNEDGTMSTSWSLYFITEGAIAKATGGQSFSGVNGESPDYIPYNMEKIYSFIYWDAVNRNAGAGNIIAIKQYKVNGATEVDSDENQDSAYHRVGATVIDPSKAFESSVFVNRYDHTAANESRIPVTQNRLKYGPVETNITVSQNVVGTEYDVIQVNESDIAGWKINLKKVIIDPDGEGTSIDGRYATTKGVNSIAKVAYVTKTNDGRFDETVFDLITQNGNVVGISPFIAGEHATRPMVDVDLELKTFVCPGGCNGADFKCSASCFRWVTTNVVREECGMHQPVMKTSGGGNQPVGLKIRIPKDAWVPVLASDKTPVSIRRYMITGAQGSLYRVQQELSVIIPPNYYNDSYGINITSSDGGVKLADGYTGFFDDNISDLEFKWRYSALLVQAYRGQIDPRIMSPSRVPAKYLFDGATNTVVGQTILPNVPYTAIDIINGSTIFTEDEKEEVLFDPSIVTWEYTDVDVKQAMYDLMIYRIYQGIPEDKRPIGPGSGLSLHLDAGVTDAVTAQLINTSFMKRFDNPNASWDIGGYVSASDGNSYTFTKRLVDNLIGHCKKYSVNKPYAMTYTKIRPDEYVSYFPDIDMTDWELREILYNSGGNAWIPDVNGVLMRRSQRTLKRGSDTSDLLQESNMRTLSQLVYLLQNKLDEKLLEYDDDAVLKTIQDECNNAFSNWVGNLVQGLEIVLERDINIDGGEIVICYVNVTFRGLILRVPIIVNVNRRDNA